MEMSFNPELKIVGGFFVFIGFGVFMGFVHMEPRGPSDKLKVTFPTTWI